MQAFYKLNIKTKTKVKFIYDLKACLKNLNLGVNLILNFNLDTYFQAALSYIFLFNVLIFVCELLTFFFEVYADELLPQICKN